MRIERRTIDLRRKRDFSAIDSIAYWLEIGLISVVLWTVFIGWWIA